MGRNSIDVRGKIKNPLFLCSKNNNKNLKPSTLSFYYVRDNIKLVLFIKINKKLREDNYGYKK